MYTRTYNFANNEGQIFDSQYGFHTNQSCEHAITELLSEIMKNIENKTSTAVIYIALSKAFDTLEHEIFLSKLDTYGIRGTALSWYRSYLTNCTLSVKTRVENEIQTYMTLSMVHHKVRIWDHFCFFYLTMICTKS